MCVLKICLIHNTKPSPLKMEAKQRRIFGGDMFYDCNCGNIYLEKCYSGSVKLVKPIFRIINFINLCVKGYNIYTAFLTFQVRLEFCEQAEVKKQKIHDDFVTVHFHYHITQTLSISSKGSSSLSLDALTLSLEMLHESPKASTVCSTYSTEELCGQRFIM